MREESTLLFIKSLLFLLALDTGGYLETNNCNKDHSSSDENQCSQLNALCMRCDHASTLHEVLNLCPQLRELYLVSQRRLNIGQTTFPPVEKSLQLIHKTHIRALHLRGYTELCNEDVAALHYAHLQTFTVVEAGDKLNDKAILQLLPTLTCLHTLELNNCKRLSYKLVLQVPPLCLTLRSYTYFSSRIGVSDSRSSYVSEEVLPQIFPHVRSFRIMC